MSVGIVVRNESRRKGCYRRDVLTRLAERVYAGEGARGRAELSVVLCDDPFIQELNCRYRGINRPADVLSFEQPPLGAPKEPRLLGDIVISLETVERRCAGERAAMRDEVRLLFCHGLLHLLGHDHATPRERARMVALQARYLGVARLQG